MKRSYIKCSTAFAAASMLATSPLHAVKEPLRLAPSSNWGVNYMDDSCRLERAFGEGDQQVYLALDRFVSDEYFKVTLVGKPVKLLSELRQLTIQFGSAEPEQKVPFLIGKMGKNLPAVLVLSPMRIIPATEDVWRPFLAADAAGKQAINLLVKSREDAVTEISIRAIFKQTVVLEVGPLRDALKAFENCTEQLLPSWGLNIEQHRTMTRMASPLVSPARWFLPEDYPPEMSAQNSSYLINYRLNINDAGFPTTCRIQGSTGNKKLEDSVCESLIKRARFDPALDANGKAMASYFVHKVIFRSVNRELRYSERIIDDSYLPSQPF